ncbi:uncharacterized protein LOC135399885 [Ornithodoros turicata]|uniref:uncharacterized protein LOC135399885 n=1 Tax=Ornithodoros turicata TaxID=34597 RepID=UPI003138E24F
MMKVFAFSFVLFVFLKVVTSQDCESAGEEVATCVSDLDKLPLYDDAFLDTLETDEEKEAVLCCALDDMDDCVKRHLAGNCAHLAGLVSQYAREVFLEEIADEAGTLSCPPGVKRMCDALRSLAGN